jgi:phosphoglycolate phosphatase
LAIAHWQIQVKTSFPLPVRAVAIDLDGTLLNTAPDLTAAANRMLVALGFRPLDSELITNFIGKGIANLVRRCLETVLGNEPDPALLETAILNFSSHYARNLSDESRPYRGAVKGLKAMVSAGFRLACITNKAESFTVPLLERTGVAHFFELTVSGDTLPEKKPHPLPLLHCARVFRIAPAELLVIGDSRNDSEAARAAGCPIFCVSYGYHNGYALEELDPDAIVDSLEEAARLIRLAPRRRAMR